LEHLYCPRGADGRWKPPCTNSLRYVLKDIDPHVFEQAVSAWLRERGLLGRVSALSIGHRSQPPLGAQDRPSPWHLQWAQQDRSRRPTAVDEPTAAAETVVLGATLVTL
jgi:hypothetical protein